MANPKSIVLPLAQQEYSSADEAVTRRIMEQAIQDLAIQLDKVQKYLGFSWTMLNNTVNHYNVQNLIENPFDNQGLDDIKTDIYNKLNRAIG